MGGLKPKHGPWSAGNFGDTTLVIIVRVMVIVIIVVVVIIVIYSPPPLKAAKHAQDRRGALTCQGPSCNVLTPEIFPNVNKGYLPQGTSCAVCCLGALVCDEFGATFPTMIHNIRVIDDTDTKAACRARMWYGTPHHTLSNKVYL